MLLYRTVLQRLGPDAVRLGHRVTGYRQDAQDALLTECRDADPELKRYLADRFAALLATPAFMESLSGHLPGDAASQQRLPGLVHKLHSIAGLH